MGSSQSKKPEVQATVVLPQDDPNDPDTYTLLKVLLLGDTPGHEKSVLLLQYTEPEFMETHTSTIGIDFKTHRTHVDGRNVRLQIWDVPSPRNYRSAQSSYFRGSSGSILVFNVGDRASFDACFALGERARAMSDAVLVCCGVTGKGEDALTPRVVTEAEARARCEESGVEYFEADLGASDGRVEAVFTALVRAMLRPRREPDVEPQENNNNNNNENV